ncbi:DUF350 domain-containing protein [Micromonospora sagamiensis]|uniref:Uncharacterized protein DUF350 n=1 Tax=Micromonospora sagamiensis TaxID=47875 RepID=A0A562WCY9_9ACTN|nr:DUF350 domain-containing protein [Micromonospora sagamiensis]TWJ27995.1 uncharacterized protein DUF350 [Micromonospora sagamiensis]BCL13116.1 hypothetical protein GCM10017556_08550 [Micromonospora sagamiensis]
MLEDLLTGAMQSVVYGIVGVVLMAAGFGLVDVLTPGKLRDLIWVQRNGNAALLLAANQLGIAAIVFTAIFTSYDDFAKGLASTAVFGLVGLLIMALAFFALDLLTPGRLGAIICADEPHPAARVSAATHFGAALIVCACIA